MAEWIEIETLKYHLRCRLVVRGETWEFWQGFRDVAMLRYKTGREVIDFDGEWLGWDHVLKLYFQLQIPAEVEIGGRRLEESEVDSLAAQIHLVLCSMKQRNAVVRKIPWPPLHKRERDHLLQEFQHRMEQRGWSVTVNRADEKISIKGIAVHPAEAYRNRHYRAGSVCSKGLARDTRQGNRPNRPLGQRGCEADFKLACSADLVSIPL